MDSGTEQPTIWNGHAGETWARCQDLLDAMMQPFEGLLTEAAQGRMLDVGCGTGATTLAAARAGASCVGIDISRPMIELARRRASDEGLSADFVCADAQDRAFAPGAFESIISRFGVMFFDDPVKAFANLRGAIRTDGRLRFVAWRDPAENAFMTTAERAAAPYLPELPPRRRDAPGQFAFADRDRVAGILKDGGWTGVGIEPLDVVCAMPVTRLADYYRDMGPVGLHLRQAGEAVRARLLPVLKSAFDRYVEGDEARFDAACWLVDARPG